MKKRLTIAIIAGVGVLLAFIALQIYQLTEQDAHEEEILRKMKEEEKILESVLSQLQSGAGRFQKYESEYVVGTIALTEGEMLKIADYVLIRHHDYKDQFDYRKNDNYIEKTNELIEKLNKNGNREEAAYLKIYLDIARCLSEEADE